MSTLFACKIASSKVDIPLGIEIWLDSKCILDVDHVKDVIDFSHEFGDTNGQHTFQWRLKNKLPTHTEIDNNGVIIRDAILSISNILFDEIDCSKIVTSIATYTHDCNGFSEIVVDKFYGDIGCNGTVELKFTTPIYLWLLDSM
jgi:hypothetical protein